MNKLMILFAFVFLLASCADTGTSEIITAENGYRYQIVKKGTGEKAIQGDFAYFNANVESLEGEVVFSSKETGQPGIMKLDPSTDERPNPFGDIIMGTNVGDSVHIYLGKGQGVEGSGHDSLIYMIGFYEMVDEAGYNERMVAEQMKNQEKMVALQAEEAKIADMVTGFYQDFKAGKLSGDIKTTDSGLKYIMFDEGKGDQFQAGDRATVNYYGILSRTGEMFDNSWKRGQAFSFPLGKGQVIKGWDEGVALLKKGAKVMLIIPSELGYGAQGSGMIQAGDELIFYIEVPE